MTAGQELLALLDALRLGLSSLGKGPISWDPPQRPGEAILDYFRRHESLHRAAVDEAIFAWLQRRELPEAMNAGPKQWLRARLEFALMLATAMAAPLQDASPYLPLTEDGRLDPDWPSWLLLEAWDFAGKEHWLQQLADVIDPLRTREDFDAGAE